MARSRDLVHRLVRVLYRIRKPHCRHRTGSPPLMRFRAPQSPQRYSTPARINPAGTPVPEADAADPPGAPGLSIPPGGPLLMIAWRKGRVGVGNWSMQCSVSVWLVGVPG
jgi:hypothetical protein